MTQNLTQKILIILFVLGVCSWALYPPSKSLLPGPDLAGGTSLLYEVNIPEGAYAEEVMRRTIQGLQIRVDPNGTRNLIWKVEGGNRIEIQMPKAGPEVEARKNAYDEAKSALEENNVSVGEIERALRLDPAEREKALAGLVRGVEGRKALFDSLVNAWEQLEEARKNYEPFKGTTDASDVKTKAAMKVAGAERIYEELLKGVRDYNLNVIELEAIAEQSDSKDKNKNEQSARERQLDNYIVANKAREDEIRKFIKAYDAYFGGDRPYSDPNVVKRLLKGTGDLEYRIVVSPEEAPDVSAMLDKMSKAGPKAAGNERMKWFKIDDLTEFLNGAATANRIMKAYESAPAGQGMQATLPLFNQQGYIGVVFGGEPYVLLWDTRDKSLSKRQEGWKLESASPGVDRSMNQTVNFTLNAVGGTYMGSLTGNNIGRQMAIVLDEKVFSAPRINGEINSRGQITGGQGGFSTAELEYLLRVLDAGSLEARLSDEPIQERTFGATIGQDNLERGLKAALTALIVVGVFMVVYYFFSGLVAGLALLANLVIILGLMAGLHATFTLPGIAGIVLTIGMCVDANVLIFERIREELNVGADMKTALRLGYERAFSSIIDGNITNLIVCFILGYTATAEIKGFAVTLGIGICSTLFTSLFMTRVIFTVMLKLNRKMKFGQLPVAVPAVDKFLTPNISWVSKRALFFTLSAVLLTGSLVAINLRGSDILDIEFSSGTEVAFELGKNDDGSLKTMKLKEARERVNSIALDEYTDAGGKPVEGHLNNLATANVINLGDDLTGEGDYNAFTVVTTEIDSKAVASAIRRAFSDVLDQTPSYNFALSDASSVKEAPVYPISNAELSEVVNEPDVQFDASEYLGGVAVLLKDINPGINIEELKKRVNSTRFDPDHNDVTYQKFDVIPVARSTDEPGKYSAVVLVAMDDTLNYFNSTENWETRLASPVWRLSKDALQAEKSLSKVSNFAPTAARTMRDNAIVALILSCFAIVAYIWLRFGSFRYGLAAIAALIHDVIITLGLVAVSGLGGFFETGLGQALLLDPFKLNMAMIAALLTIIGYSLNDTIVLFDRVRENRGKLTSANAKIVDNSINQVISRTALTSLTTFMAVFLMYAIGGPGIHGFAFAMTAGVLVGTYSSIAIASPLLLIGGNEESLKVKAIVPVDEDGEPVDETKPDPAS